jgi:carbon storage regulator
MLYLTRRAGEAVIINNAIEVRVVEVRGRTVRLGFRFPAEASVLREEVFLQISRENEEAARAVDGAVELALQTELSIGAGQAAAAEPP